MRKLCLVAGLCLLLPASAGATLIGDTVSGCFSDTGCSDGFAGSFSSSSATVSEVTVEFSGSESGFDVSADFLTYGGNDVIRIQFLDPGSVGPSLAADWELAFFDLDGLGSSVTVTGATIDTSFQFGEIETLIDPADCGADTTCQALVAALQVTAKAEATPSYTSLTTTADSVVLVFDEILAGTTDPDFLAAPWFDIVLETTVVPEPSTASLLALGLIGLAAKRRRSD